MVPVECVVRGYITGSGWKDYQATGAVCGIELPAGLRESEQLPEPIFTPATKAEVGDHDENVDFDRAAEIVGDRELLEELRRLSIAIYRRGAEHARERGIILADTKFEFGRRAGRHDRARRRGADARLVALLAGRRLRARPRAAELRQAVRARLGERVRLGQDAAGAGAARRRGRAARARSTWRPTSASPASRSSAGWSGAALEGAGADQAEGGHPRPRRPDRGGGAAGARLRGRAQRARGPADRARRRGRRRRCRRCASGCWPTR